MRVLIHQIYFTITLTALNQIFKLKGAENVICTTKFDIAKQKIFEYNPHIFISHIHTLDGIDKFEQVRSLTKEIRAKLPNCVIVITLHPGVYSDSKYRQTNLVDYEFDAIGDDGLSTIEIPNEKEYNWIEAVERIIGLVK